MLKAFGLKNVKVLDGEIQAAEKERLRFLSEKKNLAGQI